MHCLNAPASAAGPCRRPRHAVDSAGHAARTSHRTPHARRCHAPVTATAPRPIRREAQGPAPGLRLAYQAQRTVNPCWGHVHRPNTQAAGDMASWSSTTKLMPRSFYREQWKAGRLQRQHLQAVIAHAQAATTVEALTAALDQSAPATPRPTSWCCPCTQQAPGAERATLSARLPHRARPDTGCAGTHHDRAQTGVMAAATRCCTTWSAGTWVCSRATVATVHRREVAPCPPHRAPRPNATNSPLLRRLLCTCRWAGGTKVPCHGRDFPDGRTPGDAAPSAAGNESGCQPWPELGVTDAGVRRRVAGQPGADRPDCQRRASRRRRG